VIKKKISILIFPGSNCDRDLQVAVKKCFKLEPELIWHDTSYIKKTDLVFIPGGFSFGDYLRAGKLATMSPVIKEIKRLDTKGTPIIGICNGFQILTECRLLDGALIKNSDRLFQCKNVHLKVINNVGFLKKFKINSIIKFPIANSQGNFFVDKNKIRTLEDNNQIALKYSSSNGETDLNSNPNGSVQNIAGIFNRKKNVLGLMPHPERAIEKFTSEDGINFFESIREFIK
tara:strand:+ start:1306 stop:1998 length:693 start_codon:yes stop_codon:yes gene_type:complete